MKQLVITLGTSHKELSVKDFLAASTHSPEWIGDVDNWEIKTIYPFIDSKGKQNVSALINNENWVEPTVKAITGNAVAGCINDVECEVQLATKEGLDRNIPTGGRSYSIQFRSRLLPEYNVLCCESNKKTFSKDLLNDIGFRPSSGSIVIDELSKLEENNKLTASLKLAITLVNNNADINSWPIHPVTDARIVDGKLILIYNQDIDLRDIKNND